jgi:hypothetical protein
MISLSWMVVGVHGEPVFQEMNPRKPEIVAKVVPGMPKTDNEPTSAAITVLPTSEYVTMIRRWEASSIQ